jgi:ABC-type multidrug transport system ATPase subunit
MVHIAPTLTLTTLMPLLLTFFVMRIFTSRLYLVSKQSQVAVGKLSATGLETLSQIQLIQAIGAEKSFVGRMKKRVGLAIATVHNPELLILDEPFSGLDIYHIRTLENYLSQRKVEGRTTILSTHIIPFVAKMADRCYLIRDRGVHALDIQKEPDFLRRIEKIDSIFFGGVDTAKVNE